jgi:hypothetical protein
MFHFVYVPHFVYLLSTDRQVGYFPVSTVTMSPGGHGMLIPLRHSHFKSFNYVLTSEVAGSQVDLFARF